MARFSICLDMDKTNQFFPKRCKKKPHGVCVYELFFFLSNEARSIYVYKPSGRRHAFKQLQNIIQHRTASVKSMCTQYRWTWMYLRNICASDACPRYVSNTCEWFGFLCTQKVRYLAGGLEPSIEVPANVCETTFFSQDV